MVDDKKYAVFILIRYLFLVIAGVSISLFYRIFLPLTIYPVYFLLDIIYNVSISGNMLMIGDAKIEIINACVAGSAYYLLLILNLTTGMKAKQRIYSLFFSFFTLLVLNILRIVILSVLYTENFVFFDITHKLFWYALSVLFVVGIWFLAVRIFRIKNIPIYSDMKELLARK